MSSSNGVPSRLGRIVSPLVGLGGLLAIWVHVCGHVAAASHSAAIAR